MEDKQGVNLNRILSNRWVIGIAASSITLCLWAIFGIVNLQTLRLAVNQKQWKASEPSAYYMRVVEGHSTGNSWNWAVYVQDSRPITVTVLENKRPQYTSSFDPAYMIVEQIFSLAESCAKRGVIDCGIEFDPEYHYPKWILSYETFIVEVEQFRPCRQSVADCPTETEASPP